MGVSVICPGFVESRITAGNRFPMPLFMKAPKAGRIIRCGLAKNRPRIAFPLSLNFMAWLLGSLPPGWTDGVFAKTPDKEWAWLLGLGYCFSCRAFCNCRHRRTLRLWAARVRAKTCPPLPSVTK